MHPVVLLLLLGAAAALSTDDDEYAVPPGLLIGAGLSAMQAEGNIDMEAWWGASPEGMNLTVSADHYHRYKEDLQLAKKMKLSIHRFSIAWERIFPEGDASKPSDEGVNFYHDYIQEVRKNDMEPVVTIFFFSFPIAVAQRINGGWTNQSMIDEYLQFADFLFKTYGDKVKYWVSVNEPNMYCPYFTPSSDIEVMYRCNHNLILAHMKAHKLYKKKYGQYGGQVGYSLLLSLAQPASTHYLDVIAADGWNTVYAGAAFHALTYGDYPAQFRYLADEGARRDGYKGSRLPYFTEEEKRDLVGSSDFFGVNIYETLGAAYKDPSTPAEASRLWKKMVRDLPFLNLTDSQDLMSPYPMEFSLLWAWNNFHVPLLITENGYGDMTGMGIHDHDRAVYHSLNIRTLVRTMKNHGVKVIGYCAWSLIDVFEWSGDYRQPFGLIHVDQFETGSLNRTLKESSKLFIEIGETGRVPKVEPTSGAAMHSLSSALLVLLLGCALQ